MKFGIANAIRNHPAKAYPLADVYRDYIGDAVLAEELGYSFSWYGEHRMTPCQWTPSPLTVCAWVAAKTRTMRVGPQVLCLPFHNPLRVAEDVAVIDIMSNGRFDFGIGVGSQFEEFRTFGINSGRARRPHLGDGRPDRALLCRAGDLQLQGKYQDFRDHLHHQAGAAEDADLVGRRGPEEPAARGAARLPPDGGRQPQGLQRLRRTPRAAGRNPADHCIGPMTFTCIADTEEQAWEASLEGIHYFINFYMLRRKPAGRVAAGEQRVHARRSAPRT
ncbi:MAG: LLM class flavin-dependent oxidoreductase [Rubrivivax sp.]